MKADWEKILKLVNKMQNTKRKSNSGTKFVTIVKQTHTHTHIYFSHT
jgi:hypothetical protein